MTGAIGDVIRAKPMKLAHFDNSVLVKKREYRGAPPVTRAFDFSTNQKVAP